MSPVFDLADIVTYADDNYIIEMDSDADRAIRKVKMKAETIIHWLTSVGMKVNTEKTEFCIFARNDIGERKIKIVDSEIKTSKTIKVLGVTFDSKLNWYSHVQNQIKKCISIIAGLKIIRKYFNNEEFLNVVNSMFYSKLYYASQIWLIPSLNRNLKNKLLLTTFFIPLSMIFIICF